MKLYPYQQTIMDQITTGYRPGKMILYTAGRQTGKSTYSQYVNQWQDMQEQPKCKIITQAEVDGKTWYTITCRMDVSIWLRENGIENIDWHEHIDGNWNIYRNMFDICEELYLMLVLKFGK